MSFRLLCHNLTLPMAYIFWRNVGGKNTGTDSRGGLSSRTGFTLGLEKYLYLFWKCPQPAEQGGQPANRSAPVCLCPTALWRGNSLAAVELLVGQVRLLVVKSVPLVRYLDERVTFWISHSQSFKTAGPYLVGRRGTLCYQEDLLYECVHAFMRALVLACVCGKLQHSQLLVIVKSRISSYQQNKTELIQNCGSQDDYEIKKMLTTVIIQRQSGSALYALFQVFSTWK